MIITLGPVQLYTVKNKQTVASVTNSNRNMMDEEASSCQISASVSFSNLLFKEPADGVTLLSEHINIQEEEFTVTGLNIYTTNCNWETPSSCISENLYQPHNTQTASLWNKPPPFKRIIIAACYQFGTKQWSDVSPAPHCLRGRIIKPECDCVRE